MSSLGTGDRNGLGQYALLVLPAANRVYAQTSVELTVGELEVFNHAVLGGRVRDVAPARIGGVPYVCFAVEGLGARDVALLANLSSAHALFELRGELLRPLELRPLDRFDDDLVTIQRYPGKTNERFTRLLLNVTILASAFRDDLLERRFSVLDPLCGRGTTLNQALLCGFDAAGIDVDARDFDAYVQFIRTWLQHKRLKHRSELTTVRRDRKAVGRRLDVTLGDGMRLTAVNADTNRALEFFRARSFDVLVADLPYGVQHGSRPAGARLSRSPVELLAGALPAWTELLRPGGAIGLAWNTNVASRDELTGVLGAGGLEVLTSEPYLRFRHRVDQAIVRDVLVARRPGRDGSA